MSKSLRWKLYTCVFISILSLYLVFPTIHSLSNPDQEDSRPGWLPPTAMRLGLDLKGGVHLVLGVDIDKVLADNLTNLQGSVKDLAAKENLTVTSTAVSKTLEADFIVGQESDRVRLESLLEKNFGVLEIISSKGNTVVTRLVRSQEDYIRQHTIDQTITTIRNRIDEFGVSEPQISRKGDSQILVQFPGEKDPDRLKDLIGQTAKLNFQMIHGCTESEGQACIQKQKQDLQAKILEAEKLGGYTRETFTRFSDYRTRINQDLKDKIPPDTTIAFERVRNINVPDNLEYFPLLLSTKNLVSGEYISEAFVGTSRQSQFSANEIPVVYFKLDSIGAPLFGKLTTDFTKHYMAIVLDENVKSYPTIDDPITGGSGMIRVGQGSYDEISREASDLAIVLRAGALPASIEVQEERVIGPSIGQDAIDAGKRALLISAVLISLFLVMYYGVAGGIATVVNLVNVALVFAVLGAVNATLTLPGIAGIVLTLGMAVDALIIVFERMRDETRAGRNVRQIVDLGFDKAFSTILDSNVTTAIGGFVLLQFGTGSIRGFALTLIIGILINVFMATFFMKTLMEWYATKATKGLSLGMSQSELNALPQRG